MPLTEALGEAPFLGIRAGKEETAEGLDLGKMDHGLNMDIQLPMSLWPIRPRTKPPAKFLLYKSW